MMDYEKIVKTIIDPIVEDSDSVLLRVNEEEKDVLIIIAAEKDDTARLIGRKGIIANAIREVLLPVRAKKSTSISNLNPLMMKRKRINPLFYLLWNAYYLVTSLIPSPLTAQSRF